MIELPRRKFLTTLAGVIAAPAVIKADSLMKVRTIVQPVKWYGEIGDGVALTSIHHPHHYMDKIQYSGLPLSRFAEIVRPALEAVIEECYINIDPQEYTRIFTPQRKGWLS